MDSWDFSASVFTCGLQIMWAEAMGKLEGMESSDRERLWPQLVQGFKDLSARLKVGEGGESCLSFHLFCGLPTVFCQ